MLDAATSAKVNSGSSLIFPQHLPTPCTNISAVLIFGDPMNGTAVGSISAAKTKVICHTGDNICQGGDSILQPHLTVSE